MFNGINRKDPFDNTYNTDPAEAGAPPAGSMDKTSDKTETEKKKKKRKKRKRRKKSRANKKGDERKTEADLQPEEHRVVGQVLQNVDINVRIHDIITGLH